MPGKNIHADVSDEEIDYDALVNRVQRGESECFKTIVRRLERPIRSWLANRGGKTVDVDEIAQRSFVVVYSRLRTYEPGSNFPAWVFSIVVLVSDDKLFAIDSEHFRIYSQLILSAPDPEMLLKGFESLESAFHPSTRFVAEVMRSLPKGGDRNRH